MADLYDNESRWHGHPGSGKIRGRMIFTAENKYLPIVQRAADRYNVPASLIFAHMKEESTFDQNAYRPEPSLGTASYGLLQLLLPTAKSLDSRATPDALYDPEYNVNLGTALMAKNLIRYGGSLTDEAASYNAGTAWKNENGEYTNSKGDTKVNGYVNRIMRNYGYYQSWLDNGAKSFDITVFDVTTINPYLIGVFSVMALLTIMRARKTMEVRHGV